MKKILSTKNFCVSDSKKEILHDITFDICENDVVVLVGANGAGKSTLVRAIAGIDTLNHTGELLYDGDRINNVASDERARRGIFLSYQEPVSIPGLNMRELLRSALEARGQKMSLSTFKLLMTKELEKLSLSPFLTERDLGAGLSGGEKKKLEILQLLVLKPRLTLLDEIDSGLDIDAAKDISRVLNEYQKETHAGMIIITHNMRIINSLDVTKVIYLDNGRITKTGGLELINDIIKHGLRNATR